MSVYSFFLKVSFSSKITFYELVCIINQRFKFSRLKESILFNLGIMIDSGNKNISCLLTQ